MKLVTLAESLGAVESLVDHPATMTHASIPKEEREAVGISDGLLRFSIGIEDINDIISDIDYALSKVWITLAWLVLPIEYKATPACWVILAATFLAEASA